MKTLECGFSYTFDNSTTQKEFEAQMEWLGMNDWKVFGTTVFFYKKRYTAINYSDDEDSDDESCYEEQSDNDE